MKRMNIFRELFEYSNFTAQRGHCSNNCLYYVASKHVFFTKENSVLLCYAIAVCDTGSYAEKNRNIAMMTSCGIRV